MSSVIINSAAFNDKWYGLKENITNKKKKNPQHKLQQQFYKELMRPSGMIEIFFPLNQLAGVNG